MTDQSAITAEIRARSEGSYDAWHIGVTQDLDAAVALWEEAMKEDTGLWMDWETDSIEEAMAIAEHFVSLGMVPGPAEDLDRDAATYVYVF
jgi:hypothetical protein